MKLPAATPKPIGWIDTLFTSTSAMTVTGLAVVDTGTDYTMFGQLIILVLIQLGGLGIMSFAVLIFIMLGKKIGLKERLLIQQSLNQTSLGGIIKLIKSLFIYSFAIEMLAMLILAVKWIPEYGLRPRGIYYSLFHAVSSFNNAGFSIWPDSLMRYEGDPLVNLVISFLFIVGGIGFTVLSDLWHKRSFKKLSLHSKLMIYGTFIVNLAAMILIFLLEYQNQKTLGMLPLAEKLWGAYFQAVTPRTAGLTRQTSEACAKARSRFCSFLCLSERGSASTGGGIKLTTFLVILLSVITFLKGKKHISIAKKTLKDQLILRSLAISTISVLLILTAIFILNMTEPIPFLAILFEVVSAFGTVGLSMGITADLSPIGKMLIVFIMFLGKLGPLTLAFSLARPEKENIRYSSEDILTG